MKGLLKEFETFAVRGNAIELAVGVLVGAAFSQVTTSLANNILTPPIGLLAGGIDFSELSLSLGPNVVIEYGAFIEAVINFFITAVTLFFLLKALNRLMRRRKQEEKKEAERPELKVLTEIRDELRKYHA